MEQLTADQIERGGKACYRVWTVNHIAAPPWETLRDWEREKWRVVFLAAVQEMAIPDDGLRLPKEQFDGITLRERLLAKRLRERRTS